MSILSNVKTYAKLVWENLPSKKTPVDAKNLNRMEEGIAWNNEAIKEIADAVMSEIVNDPNKIASLAAVYSVKQDITKATQALGNKITNPAIAAVGQVLAVKSVDANGKPTEYETVKNEASPADWSVNDENVSGYVANRTHWKEVLSMPGTVLSETTIHFGTNEKTVSGAGTSNIKFGETYAVTWAGTEYNCTASTHDGSVMLGNASLAVGGADTGEPFCIRTASEVTSYVMKAEGEGDSVSIKIETVPVEVCAETSLSFPSSMVALAGVGTGNVFEGKTYTVVWNGTIYTCTAFSKGGQSVYLGNGSMVGDGEDTGEPFVIELLSEDSSFVLKSTTTKETITIKVDTAKETVLASMTINYGTSGSTVEGIGTANMKAGGIYVITWDGTDYERTAFEVDQRVFIGNAALAEIGNDTGEPFCIELVSAYKAFATKAATSTVSAVIKIEGKESVIYHTIDPNFIPPGISGGVSSWNDLEDKPFGYVPEEVAVLEETTFTGSSQMAMGWLIHTDIDDLSTHPFILEGEAGDEYRVVCNGTTCVCKLNEFVVEDGLPAKYIGNTSLYPFNNGMEEVDTGEPFVFSQTFAAGNVVQTIAVITNGVVGPSYGTQTLSIYRQTLGIKQLEPKFVEGMYYEEGERKEIFPLTTAVVGESIETASFVYTPDDGIFIFSANITLDIKAGKTYVVSINGTEYSCVATSMVMDGTAAVALGDVFTLSGGEVGGAPTGDPFCIMFVPSGMIGETGFSGMGTFFVEPPAELTIGISGDSEIHYIPPKYIKDMYYSEENVSYVIENFTFDASELANGGIVAETQTLLEIGKSYKLNVNGAERSYVAQDFAGAVYIGNPSGVGNTDDGFPYGFTQMSGSTEGEFLAFEKPTEGTFVVSISYGSERICKIPERYLPDPPKMYSEMVGENTGYYLYKDEALTTKLSRDEVIDLFLRGAKICIFYNGELALACTPMGMEVSSDCASLTYAAGGLDLSFYSSEYTIE